MCAKSNEKLSERVEQAMSVGSRVLVWGLLFAVLFILRGFFLLIFLTFVFAYIQANCVRRLEPWIKRRPARVVLAALALLTVIISVGAFLAPSVKEQARLFAERYPKYLQSVDTAISDLSQRYTFLQALLPDNENDSAPLPTEPWDARTSPAVSLIQAVAGSGEQNGGGHDIKSAFETLQNVGAYLLSISSAFLLSLLFSFLIVLDLPKLAQSIRGLRKTKLQFVYEEVSDTILNFGQVLGRALEAQLLIAIFNTMLTGLGLSLLGFTGKLSFFLVIVFFCSFIPVAGVFISSVPICLVALQEAGFSTVLMCIGVITAVHMIEAYVLNPKIYGHHLHMNPVIVLIILTIGGKLFHVWGLVLGVPICTYIFGYAIRDRKDRSDKVRNGKDPAPA